MSWTASPGMRRGSAKTTREAISSEGTAITSRVRTYRFSMGAGRAAPSGRRPGPAAAPALAVQPRGHQPPAVVVADVRSVVLERGVPDRDVHAGVRRDVVLLLGQVALDLVDDLAPLDGIGRPALADQQIGRHRVVDVALVARLLGIVVAVQERVGLEERR